MKLIKKKLGLHKIKKILFIGVIMLSLGSYGQIVPPPIPPPPPPGLPIDGGIGFLILGAIIYGTKNIKNSSSSSS